MAEIRRRQFLGSAVSVLPASILMNTPRAEGDDNPVGRMKAVATRLILKVYTDAGVVGYGEGTGGGAELFRQGLADLVIDEDPFMVGRVWEKLFALTYSRELVKRGWSRTGLVEA